MTMTDDDSRTIVNLSPSFDLTAFPSEAEPTEDPSARNVAAEQVTNTVDTMTDAAPVAEVAAVADPLTAEPWQTEQINQEPPQQGPSAEDVLHGEVLQRDEPWQRAPQKQATITEFPTQGVRAQAMSSEPLVVASPLTLVDLLERQGGMDWRQAVKLVQQICEHLKQQNPPIPILLEPRNILINHQGEVNLLPGQPGGDPLVIQLGRLLRTMLRGADAPPPELRLLLAQATFELPIFESVEDVDRALRQLESLEEASGRQTASGPRVQMPPIPEERPAQRPATRSILPDPQLRRQPAKRKRRLGSDLYTHGLRVASIVVGVTILAAFIASRTERGLFITAGTSGGTAAPLLIAPASSAVPGPNEPAAAPDVEKADAGTTAARPTRPTPPNGPRARTAQPDPSPRGTDGSGPASNVVIGTVSAPTEPVGTLGARARESERRATQLMALGQTAEASMAFDALVLSNPLYEPRPGDLTPESLAALRSSQRLLLPGILQKYVDRGTAALNAGDFERALQYANDARIMAGRGIVEAPQPVRVQLESLIDDASAAKYAADQVVYNVGDKGIVAPRPLSPQFPLRPPVEVPPHRVGTLEMIIDRAGNVEFVKLHTPLNRYHERMIVSAAKAWRYRPATKDGRAVKCRISVKVNLPESGTDY